MYKISGVHHVAIGVASLEKMKAFYQGVLACSKVFAEFPQVEHEAMSELLRTSGIVFSAILCSQEAGGIIFELAQMATPAPRAIRRDFRYGDIGVAKTTIAVSDLERFYGEQKGRINFLSRPKSVKIPKWGSYNFVYGKDPEGNLIELASGDSLPARNGFGGARWVGVSVTDLERSMSFYRKHFRLDKVIIDVHESFSGLVDEVSGGHRTGVLSCLLANSQGDGMVELFEVTRPRGRSIPFATRWGDFGYLQLCFNCDNVEEMAAYCEKEGLDFLTHLKVFNDERAGAFIYVRDPDGIPVEFLDFGS